MKDPEKEIKIAFRSGVATGIIATGLVWLGYAVYGEWVKKWERDKKLTELEAKRKAHGPLANEPQSQPLSARKPDQSYQGR